MTRVYPPIEAKPINNNLPSSFIETAAGFTAGTVSTLVVHPFDVVKTRLQSEAKEVSSRQTRAHVITSKSKR